MRVGISLNAQAYCYRYCSSVPAPRCLLPRPRQEEEEGRTNDYYEHSVSDGSLSQALKTVELVGAKFNKAVQGFTTNTSTAWCLGIDYNE